MLTVQFHDHASDNLLRFAVILAHCGEELVLCRHRDRTTWEFPGGHREADEGIAETAARELREETGARAFELEALCHYAVEDGGEERLGMLFHARIFSFEPELRCEIQEIRRTRTLPDNWTYPEIQPALLAEAARRGLI